MVNQKEELKEQIAILQKELKNFNGTPCEVYSRIVGYHRPIKFWNTGKKEEFNSRSVYTSEGICNRRGN